MTILGFDIPELETSLATPKQDLVQVSAWVHYSRHLKWHFVKCYLQVLLCGTNKHKRTKLFNWLHKNWFDWKMKNYWSSFQNNQFTKTCSTLGSLKQINSTMILMISSALFLQHKPSDSTSQTMTVLSRSTEMMWSPKGSRRWTSAPWPVYMWTTWIDARISQSVYYKQWHSL